MSLRFSDLNELEITMKDRKTGWLLILFCAAFLWMTGADVLAQEEETEELPDITEICKKLDKLYKDKRNLDEDSILALYQMLDGRFKKATKSEQKKMAKTVRKVYEFIRPMPTASLYAAAAGLLSGMDKMGRDALFYGLRHKNLKVKNKNDDVELRKKMEIQTFIIEAIGFNKHPSSLKELCKLLWDDSAEIIIATCKALACYKKLPLKERKPIVKELVKVYVNINSLSVANPKRPDYREKLIRVEVPFNETLRALTLQSIESPVEWERWYNNNKNKPRW